MLATDSKYIIDYHKALGSGSFADVFLGINIEDGCEYAFKCITNDFRGDITKEIGILQSLEHPNIVKYYDKSREFEEFRLVIITEYCNKGSLKKFYESRGGLCDNMFLLLLECFSYGFYYLREKRVVHRDIKPDNVMVHEDIMGNIHIKIGDFGEAKAVPEGQSFLSMVGTPQYMNPNMLLQHIEDSYATSFSDNMDLWSIAVTLYQVVTTRFPFEPSGGPHDLGTLGYMYKARKPGFICCKQASDRLDDLQWSQSLPDGCKLSPMLRGLVSKLIDNLMDLGASNTYKRFFDEAKEILEYFRVPMFTGWNGQLQLLYLNNLSYRCLTDGIFNCTGNSKHDLIILTKLQRINTKSSQFLHRFRPIPINRLLKYQLTDETVLVIRKVPSSQNNYENPFSKLGRCQSPPDKFVSSEDVRKDSTKLQTLIYQIDWDSNYIDCQIQCYKATVDAFNNYVWRNLKHANESTTWMVKALQNLCETVTNMLSLVELCFKEPGRDNVHIVNITNCRERIREFEKKIKEGEKCMEEYYNKLVCGRQLEEYSNKMFKETLRSGSVDSIVASSEEVFNEIMMLHRDSTLVNDECFKLMIWQRQVRLFQYFQLSEKKLCEKRENLKECQNIVSALIKTALDVDQRYEKLLYFFKRQNRIGLDLRNYIPVMKSFFVDLFNNLNQSEHQSTDKDLLPPDVEIIKMRIAEIVEIIEKLNNATYIGHLSTNY